jgi:hypothetical protein
MVMVVVVMIVVMIVIVPRLGLAVLANAPHVMMVTVLGLANRALKAG